MKLVEAVQDQTNGLIGLVLVAALWGITNPALNQSSKGISSETNQNQSTYSSINNNTTKQSTSIVNRFLRETLYLITNWKFLFPFVLNQLGSVLYLRFLSECDVSLAVPLTNSLTMVFTAIASKWIGEHKQQTFNFTTLAGIICIGIGISLCVTSKFT